MIFLALALSLAPMGDGSVWDRLAECESGGDWDYNGSSGYDGGLQFSPRTWTAMGGPTQYAWQATRSQQIAVAQRLWEVQGWGAWPGCARALGLYGTNPTADSGRVDAIADAPEVDPELDDGSSSGAATLSLTVAAPEDQSPQQTEQDAAGTGDGEASSLPLTE